MRYRNLREFSGWLSLYAIVTGVFVMAIISLPFLILSAWYGERKRFGRAAKRPE
jgi:uncharacterized membrane protein YbaN (DUF454 family)